MIEDYTPPTQYFPVCDGIDGKDCEWNNCGDDIPNQSTPEKALQLALFLGWKVIPTLKGDTLVCPCCAKKLKGETTWFSCEK